MRIAAWFFSFLIGLVPLEGVAQSNVLPCDRDFALPAPLLQELQTQAFNGIDLTESEKLGERVVYVLKVLVKDPQIQGGACIFKKSTVLKAGKPGEQIYTLVASATVSQQNEAKTWAMVPNTLRVVQAKDPYSTFNPTFSSILNEERKALDKAGYKIDGILSNSFKELRPALAVRGASCLMCHAQVKSNMITDFGIGDSYFLERDANGASVYGEYDHTPKSFQSATVTGKFVIPRYQMDKKKQANYWTMVDPLFLRESMSLGEFLRMPFVVEGKAKTLKAYQKIDEPMAVGIPDIVERDSIYIGAPKESDLLELAPDLASKTAGFVLTGGSGWSSGTPVQPQFTVTNEGHGEYVTNSQAIVDCDGDIVIKGTLFLNNVTFRVKNDGCRLYVAGSVFIQIPPKFITEGEDSAPAAQITSSRAILMGFSYSTLATRLGIGIHPHIEALCTTRAGSAYEIHPKIYADAAKLQGQLVDAGNAVAPVKGLLLNAPEVFGRYRGTFEGAVIAEIALFRVGEFDFSFDDNVLVSDFFPLLKDPILKVSKQ